MKAATICLNGLHSMLCALPLAILTDVFSLAVCMCSYSLQLVLRLFFTWCLFSANQNQFKQVMSFASMFCLTTQTHYAPWCATVKYLLKYCAFCVHRSQKASSEAVKPQKVLFFFSFFFALMNERVTPFNPFR